MIQELLGEAAAGLIGGERSKLSVHAGVFGAGSHSPSPSPSPSLSPSPSQSPSSSTTTNPTSSSTSENLRCPRCDSTNTKFCYYNNYNLTQPRHFCKTCRRYWTKGGALRNVPIGGGCRKNKGTSITSSVAKSNAVKLKTVSDEIGKSGFMNSFEHELSSNPILWASPQNSHLFSLLRGNTNPNPNPSPISNSAIIKDEALFFQSHMNSESPVASGCLNARILSLDPLGPVPSIWRNNQNQTQQQQNGVILGELQSSGLQGFYQRLRSSTNYYQDHSSAVVGNMATASSSSSTILESAPVGAAELGYWNPVLSWSDLPTTHGAYP